MLHEKEATVAAKIWLIGRSYAAAIERTKNKSEINDDFYGSIVIPKLLNRELDHRIQNLVDEKVINSDNIRAILELHSFLTNLFKEISGLEKRSLSSKYLHFHLPNLFFIYDSRVVEAMRIFVSRYNMGYKQYLVGGNVDQEYEKFFAKAFFLRHHIAEQLGMKLSPRELDNFLIKIANDKYNNKKG
jgi:hypothetical protein